MGFHGEGQRRWDDTEVLQDEETMTMMMVGVRSQCPESKGSRINQGEYMWFGVVRGFVCWVAGRGDAKRWRVE